MPLNRSKKYIPNEKEKYMCAKHKVFFKKRLTEWKNEIIKTDIRTFNQGNPVNVFLTGSEASFKETVSKLEESGSVLPDIEIKLEKLVVPNV